MPDGRILIAGGGDATGHLSLTAELYDPATGTFTQTGGMAADHESATLLDNGKVLICPGMPGGLAELYDPSTGAFTATGGYADPTMSFIAGTDTLLADGRVLSATDSASEIYDPGSGSFSLTGAMIHPHALLRRSATLLPNGKVLFSGGAIDNEYNIGADPAYPNGVFPYGELYDSPTGRFASTGNLIGARWPHTATLLPDGSALITGGGDGLTMQSAELYNALLGSFSSAATMVESRIFHDATLLNDGRVLITGGMHSLGRHRNKKSFSPAANSTRRRCRYPHLHCSLYLETVSAKALSGMQPPERSPQQRIRPLQAKPCPCMRTTSSTVVSYLRRWRSVAGSPKSCISALRLDIRATTS